MIVVMMMEMIDLIKGEINVKTTMYMKMNEGNERGSANE